MAKETQNAAAETAVATTPAKRELPPVVNLEQMKRDYPEKGEAAFYAIGLAGGFGDFSHGKHPGAQFELASLTGDHRAAVEKIFAGLNN